MSARKKLIFPFLLPCLLLIGAFFILPAINTFVISFQNWDGTFRTTDWNGLQNYAKLLKDPTFVEAVKHTFQYFLISMILLFPLALLLAVCLQLHQKGQNAHSVLYFHAGHAFCRRRGNSLEMVYLRPQYGYGQHGFCARSVWRPRPKHGLATQKRQ